MSAAAPANFNAEEADNLEDVSAEALAGCVVRSFNGWYDLQIEKQFAVKGLASK